MSEWFNNKQNLSGIIGTSVGLGVIGLTILLYKNRNKTTTPHHSNPIVVNDHEETSSHDSFKSVESADSFKSTKSKDWAPTEEQMMTLNPFYHDKASGKKSRRKLRKKRTRRQCH